MTLSIPSSPSFGASLDRYKCHSSSVADSCIPVEESTNLGEQHRQPSSSKRKGTSAIRPMEASPSRISQPSPTRNTTTLKVNNGRQQPPKTNLKRQRIDATSGVSPAKKVKRTSSGYAPPSQYAHLDNKLTDSLAPNLICVFIGLNPGIRTATTGHAYNHPSNLFWRLLHKSGCTPRLCRAEEDGDMPKLYDLGLTNIVRRPTKDGSELSKAEMDAGVAELEDKIAVYRPEAVAIVGKSIWESLWRVRHGRNIKKEQFKYGWQDDNERIGTLTTGENQWPGAKMFVATTTSGLAAGMRPHEKEEIWTRLGQWVKQRRSQRTEERV